MPGVVSVFPNVKRKLHTTHSWDFMGLSSEETMEIPGYSTKNQVNVIIGFIDTGNIFSLEFIFVDFYLLMLVDWKVLLPLNCLRSLHMKQLIFLCSTLCCCQLFRTFNTFTCDLWELKYVIIRSFLCLFMLFT